ncbi:MAG: uracil-DNA glycosylase family protein [Pseudomonadales bacterium]|nr:uracil-DNA glycosylase family protein [Pseudomonadales bacterium]
MADQELISLYNEITQCTLCEAHLPLGPRPVLRISSSAKVLIVGQAPGTKVHATGIPWNDPSGDRLRLWLNVDRDQFYSTDNFAIVPMGFCYPGKGKSGDLPPRPECAEQWHGSLMKLMPQLELILLVGKYAQDYYLPEASSYKTLTENVRHWHQYLPRFLPLPHPSPRNGVWLKKNPWFEESVVPHLKSRVHSLVLEKSSQL